MARDRISNLTFTVAKSSTGVQLVYTTTMKWAEWSRVWFSNCYKETAWGIVILKHCWSCVFLQGQGRQKFLIFLFPTNKFLCNFCTEGMTFFSFHSSPTPISSDNYQLILCIYGFCICFCFVYSFFKDFTFKWNHMVFVFFWLISLTIMPCRSIHVVTNGKILCYSFLYNSAIPHCVYIHTTNTLFF